MGVLSTYAVTTGALGSVIAVYRWGELYGVEVGGSLPGGGVGVLGQSKVWGVVLRTDVVF